MAFITLTKGQFEKILPKDYQIVDDPKSKEIIYQFKTESPNVDVRLYSTIDLSTGQTRDLGQDAIRIIFWDNKNNRPLGKGKKILRVEGATTIEQRILARIMEFLKTAKAQNIIDFNYVRSILKHESICWMEFAQSLLENLDSYGKLTEGQLAYILGEKNPKGKPTFEARVKDKDPDFFYNEEMENEQNVQEKTIVESEGENPIVEETNSAGQDENKGIRDKNGEEFDLSSRILPVGRISPFEGKLISTSEYSDWQYPFDNFNPVQSEALPYRSENANMIIGANTSAGKTICAEFLMDYTLYQENKRVIYLSPLKSLAQEKYDDWQKRFPKEQICILTGDYVLSQDMKDKLGRSRIIVMTSEMADSRTRRMHQEKNYWLKEVGLVIVDESHILSTSRGHAVETGIMRFTRINPLARILFLSATMPNCPELGEWLTTLNGKPSTIIYNTWRPVTLQMHYEEYQLSLNKWGGEDYWANQEKKLNLAVEIAMNKPDEKFLIFCHDKATGRNIVKILSESGEEAIFHNADLDLSERLEVEKKFQDRTNGIGMLVSTSTLAWGRNLPARNVIIVGVHRGINQVDELDIIQMAGRAGRYGIDDEGHVFLIIPEGTTGAWINTFINPRPVTSVLNDHRILAFHVLAEIETKEITSLRSLIAWYERSLAFRQGLNPFNDTNAKALMTDLEQMEMIGYSGINPFITNLGKVSAWLYFNPYDIFAWYRNFGKIFGGHKDDLTLAWALGDIPTNDPGFIGKDIQKEADDIKYILRNKGIQCSNAVGTVIAIYHSFKGVDLKDDNGLIKTIRMGIIFDIDWITQALNLIDEMYAKWNKESLWQTLPQRIKYGIGEELLELVRLPGIGGKRAKKLYDQGFHTLQDIIDGDKKKLSKIFPVNVLLKLQKDAEKILAS
jgi:helicase